MQTTWMFVRHNARLMGTLAAAALAADGSDTDPASTRISAPLTGTFTDAAAGSSIVDEVTHAVAVEGADPAADNPAVDLPDTASDDAGLALADGQTLTMSLPAEGSGTGTQSTTVFDGSAPDTGLVVQSNGQRATRARLDRFAVCPRALRICCRRRVKTDPPLPVEF